MFKKPEWIDEVISNIQGEIFRANLLRTGYQTNKRLKRATTQEYVEVLRAIEAIRKDAPGPTSTFNMRYNTLAASSWHGRRALKTMTRRIKAANGIDTDELLEYRDIAGDVRKGQIEKLRAEAKRLVLLSHPQQDISNKASDNVVYFWRINQLNALIDGVYRDTLWTELPTAEALVKKIDREQTRVFNEDYNNYLNAMVSFNALKYLPYKKKGERASYAEYEKIRNAPAEAYGVQLSEIGRVLVPALARAQASTDGVAYTDRLSLEGEFVPSTLESTCQKQMDDIRTALSSKAVQGLHGGRPRQSKAHFVDRVIDLYKCRPLSEVKRLTVETAIKDFDGLVMTDGQDGM